MSLIKQSPLLLEQGQTTKITSPFGMRTIKGKTKMHSGVDLVGYNGSYMFTTAIINPFDKAVIVKTYKHGRVTWTAGKTIIIMSLDEVERDYRVFAIFCHLAKIYDSPFSVLKKREVIGYMGNTGRSAGAHLHFGFAIVKDKDFANIGKLISGKYAVDPVKWGLETD